MRFVSDFDQFLDYCLTNQVSLTKTTKTIARKHLVALNGLLSVKAENVNQYSSQELYPYIHFFFHLALAGRLIEVDRHQEGAYTFKVMYATDIWRNLKLPGTSTMDDLHQYILLAYDFEDDHLYSFFMDNKKWSHNCIASPHDDSGHADASIVRIDSYGFVQGQQFIYVFDYGAEWTFRITVEEIDERNTANFTPQIIGGEGESPEQYFYEEWDEGDNEW